MSEHGQQRKLELCSPILTENIRRALNNLQYILLVLERNTVFAHAGVRPTGNQYNSSSIAHGMKSLACALLQRVDYIVANNRKFKL
jgi:hypothetical protein